MTKNRTNSEPDVETVVSVITPAFNAARRLRDCVASIRSQSFENWEHLVVDDGSTDATWALLEELKAQDARLRTIQQANAGPGAARNAAMKAASGRYFAFLDADDRATPHRLATQVAFLDEHTEVHVLGGAIVIMVVYLEARASRREGRSDQLDSRLKG